MKYVYSLILTLFCATASVAQSYSQRISSSEASMSQRQDMLTNRLETLKRSLAKASLKQTEQIIKEMKVTRQMLKASEPAAQNTTTKDVLDSMVNMNSKKEVLSIDKYFYAADGTPDSMIHYTVNENIKTPSYKYVYIPGYSTESYKRYNYTDGSWEPSSWGSRLLEYDEHGNEKLYATLRWDKTTQQWYTRSQTIDIYDEQDREIQYIESSDYDLATGKFMTETKTEWAYDNNGHKTLESKYNTEEGQVYGVYEKQYGYDDNGRLLLESSLEEWDTLQNTWASGNKEINEYYANGVHKRWALYEWNPDAKDYYLNKQMLYNEKGYDTQMYMCFLTNGTYSYLINTYAYDEEKLTVTQKDYFWDSKNPNEERYDDDGGYTLTVYKDKINGNRLIWEMGNSQTGEYQGGMYYYYTTITIDDTTPVNQVAEDHQTITVEGSKITTQGAKKVSVYNTSGQLISTAAVTNVTPGIYIVKADEKSIKVSVK